MPKFIASAPVDISARIAADNAWHTVDLSDLVPPGASGVALWVTNTGASAYRGIARKPTSTDNFTRTIYQGQSTQLLCGCNARREIEMARQNAAVTVGLQAYFGSEAVFFTNATANAKQVALTNTWEDWDFTPYLVPGDTIVAAIIGNILSTEVGTSPSGYRRKGSTDDRRTQYAQSPSYALTGVDASNVCQLACGSANLKHYAVGYLRLGAELHDNGTNRSIAGTGVYTDLTTLGAGSKCGIYEVVCGVMTYDWGLRRKSDTWDPYDTAGYHAWRIVDCDGDGIVEHKIQNANVDCYELGRFTLDPSLAAGSGGIRRFSVARPLPGGVW